MRDGFGSSTVADDLLRLADHLDDVVFGLDRASSYFWTDAMTAVIIEAATRMPRYTFTESSFPTSEGFVWHASPHSIDRIVPEGDLSSDDQVSHVKQFTQSCSDNSPAAPGLRTLKAG